MRFVCALESMRCNWYWLVRYECRATVVDARAFWVVNDCQNCSCTVLTLSVLRIYFQHCSRIDTNNLIILAHSNNINKLCFVGWQLREHGVNWSWLLIDDFSCYYSRFDNRNNSAQVLLCYCYEFGQYCWFSNSKYCSHCLLIAHNLVLPGTEASFIKIIQHTYTAKRDWFPIELFASRSFPIELRSSHVLRAFDRWRRIMTICWVQVSSTTIICVD